MKKLRNYLNLICGNIWEICFLIDISLVIKSPSIFHVVLMILHVILSCLFFKLDIERELKK